MKTEKKNFVLGLSFYGANVTSRGVFALLLSSLPRPGRRPMSHFLDSKFS